MRILAFIEEEEVIEKILKHVGPWDIKVRPSPKVKAPSVTISIVLFAPGLSAYFLGIQGVQDAMFLPVLLVFENLAPIQHFNQ